MGESVNVYFEIGFESRGIQRVVDNLARHLPASLTRCATPEQADLVVLHIIGRRDGNTRKAQAIQASGRKYAVIQYVLESSRNPDPRDWQALWSGAQVVWSYYALPVPGLYLAPLGADPQIFYPESRIIRDYRIGTNGANYRAECLGEIYLATFQAGVRALHTGQNLTHDPVVDYLESPSDDEMRRVYNRCEYYGALRRKDGFELPAAEALLCGARPIMFDAPRFRRWFDGLAEFVPETDPGTLVTNLRRLLLRGPRPVTADEMTETKNRFNWKRLVGGFWDLVV